MMKHKVLSSNFCQNKTLLDSGADGCVIQPPITQHIKSGLKKKISNKDIGKLFIKENRYLSEIELLNNVQKLDPKNQFTISVKQHSRIPMSIMNGCNYEIKDCLKYESYKPYYQIIMENAGTRIDLFDKKIKYNIFLKSFLKYIEGLNLLSSKNYVHCDIKPRNVMIKNHKLNLIDFGHMKKLDDIYNINKLNTLKFHYKYYPPEFYIAYIYLTLNSLTKEPLHLVIRNSLLYIYNKHYSQYKMNNKEFTTYKAQLNNFINHIENNKLKFENIFNYDLAQKIDVFSTYYVLSSFYDKIIYKNKKQKEFISKLMSLCRNANPIERISLSELFAIIQNQIDKKQ